jgi:hypothetical protein
MLEKNTQSTLSHTAQARHINNKTLQLYLLSQLPTSLKEERFADPMV